MVVEPYQATILSDSDCQGDPSGLELAPKASGLSSDSQTDLPSSPLNSLVSMLVKSPSDLNQLTR